MKKILSIMLSLIMVVTMLPTFAINALAEDKAFTTIKYGNYPQSRITDPDTIASLEEAEKQWIYYPYFSGYGKSGDGYMHVTNFMKYADIDLDGDGTKDYRAVYIEKFRPVFTGDYLDARTSAQYMNDYHTLTTYYFAYEPIEWLVLDAGSGLVMTADILDSQPYNNFLLKEAGVADEYNPDTYWGDEDKTYYANNYKESSLRKWLNEDFYQTAFNQAQASNIKKTVALDNSASSPEFKAYSSAPTKDKIFVLSYEEAANKSYGLELDSSRVTAATPYGRISGAYNQLGGNASMWWLRSAASLGHQAASINYDGSLRTYNVDYTYLGIRPACRLTSLKNNTVKTPMDNNIGSGLEGECSHNYISSVIAEPKCLTDGSMLYECEFCHDSRYETITAIGHSYKTSTTVRATISKDGKKETKCTVCGDVKSIATIKKVSTVKLGATKYTYDGKVKSPTLTVKDSAGKALVKGTDYTVTTPSGRKNVGKYTYKITFKGNYSGTKSLSFVINPKNTSISKLTATKGGFKATIKKYTTQTTGYQIRYSTKSNMSGAKTVTIAKNTTTSKSVTGLSKGKKYYVQIRTFKTVNGTKYYSAWSGNKTVTTKK